MTTTYPAPGRGAWRLAGGLLPAKPGSASSAGFYRLNAGTEKPIGAGWVQGSDTSHEAQCVSLGVRAIQVLIGASPDGWFGPRTADALLAAQRLWNIEVDGIVGRSTMRAALEPLVTHIAALNQVPVPLLGGLITLESSLDPAAVGVNGQDHGLPQINLAVHGNDVSLADSLDPEFSITWAASDMAHTHDIWVGKTTADPWDISIAHHNSPLMAKLWAMSGKPPVVSGRTIQISDYVARVRTSW